MQRRQVLNILRSVQGPTQVKPHCVAARLFEEDGYDESILYVECWDSEEEFERHVRSDLYRRILEAMELSRQAPELNFHRVTATQGIERVAALRDAKAVI
jgi:quinol monooxygenase YgiN